MLLAQLAMTLEPHAYLTVLKVMTNPLHQVTLPPAVMMKLEAPPAMKKMNRNAEIGQNILWERNLPPSIWQLHYITTSTVPSGTEQHVYDNQTLLNNTDRT